MGVATASFDASMTRNRTRVYNFAARARRALIVQPIAFFNNQSEQIATLAPGTRCPQSIRTVSLRRGWRLMSYGADMIGPVPRSAAYVDRILKGEKPADCRSNSPTKFELIINLKTAKALGSKCQSSLLARADEVIE